MRASSAYGMSHLLHDPAGKRTRACNELGPALLNARTAVSLAMPLPSSLKADLSVAAALAGIGLLTAAARQQPRHSPPARRPTTDAGNLAALREELRQVPDRPRATTSASGDPHGREA